MKFCARHIFAAFVLLYVVLLTVGCGSNKTDGSAKTAALPDKADSLTIELDGKDGMSVLDLTLEKHEVEAHESPMGTFVKSIDSVASGDGYWWLFTINDSTINTACDKYVTKDGDVIKWHFKKP